MSAREEDTMTTVYGLPRYVATFLRHMEAYKDLLKWNITEGSHKITLTLSWNFHHQKAAAASAAAGGGGGGKACKESLWDKLQRTLKLTTSAGQAASGSAGAVGGKKASKLPEELTRFLDASTTRKRTPTGSIKRQLSLHSPFRRQMSWSRYSALSLPGASSRSSITRSHSNPITANHVDSGAADHRHSLHDSGPAANANPGCSSFSSSHNPSPSKAHSPSPSRYSWPGTALTVDTPGLHASPQLHTPVTPSTPGSSSPHSPGGRPATLSYRAEEELATSLRDLMARTQQHTQERLRQIQHEWHQVVANWDTLLLEDTATDHGPLNSSTDSEHDPGIQDVTDTVQKCLHSCDKILNRRCTDV